MDDYMFFVALVANTKEEILYDPHLGKVFSSEDDLKFYGDNYYIKLSYRLCERLQTLRLQEEEFVLLKALCFYAPGKSFSTTG